LDLHIDVRWLLYRQEELLGKELMLPSFLMSTWTSSPGRERS
jgi:hypothetical protein